MAKAELTTYAELADVIEHLPLLVHSARRARRLSQRQVAAQAGMSFSTISRIEAGEELSTVSLCAILRWLDTEGQR